MGGKETHLPAVRQANGAKEVLGVRS